MGGPQHVAQGGHAPGLLRALATGQVTARQVARALRVTVRQVYRLQQRFAAGGAAGLVHRGRGRPSPRRLASAVRTRVAVLMQTVYAGLNDCHLTEKLHEVEGVRLSRESVRRIRRSLGMPATQPRRAPRHRRRRAPAARAGSLMLLDGSPAAWLEARGPRLTLHGALDDASGAVLALHFRPTEDLHGYAMLFAQVFATHGLPVACYGDGTAILVRTDTHWSLEEELRGVQDPTHLGRVLVELGIGYIRAHSPQAKGRIERLWRTLQDRLRGELRLRGIATLAAANAALPAFIADYNRRFAHAPADPTPAWRRPPRDLALQLSCRYVRTVARDNTVRLGPRWLQLPPGPGGRSHAGRRIELRECLDGRLVALLAGDVLAVAPAPAPDFVLQPRARPHTGRPPRPAGAARPRRPSALLPALADLAAQLRPAARRHPWRQAFSHRERLRQRILTPKG
jgi:transposase